DRDLIDHQSRDEIGAREVVVAVDDQHPHLRIRGARLPQVAGGVGELDAVLPVFADVIRERVIAALDLPADHADVEVDHGAGGRGDDGVEDRVATAALRRPGGGGVFGDGLNTPPGA